MQAFAKLLRKPLDTSKVIMEVSNDKTFTYYLPGYLRFNVKNFTSINLQNLQSEMNAAIIFSVYYGALPQHLIDHLENDIKLNFERDETIQLTGEQNLITEIKRVKQASTIHFYVKKIFHARIQSDVFWSPFELIYTIFTITVQSIVVGDTVIQINLMDHPNKLQKLFTSELNTFGNYRLAVAYTEAEYSNHGIKRRRKSLHQSHQNDVKLTTDDIVIQIIDGCGQFLIAQTMGCFRHAHFSIPLYKMPMASLSTIFIPLWLLGIINLGIFFEPSDLGNRIQAIAGLMVAFAALIPTIRSQIPPHPGWIFIQFIVHLEAATCLLALIHSLDVRDISDFTLIWQSSVYFLVSLIITILSVVYVIILAVIHYCFWQPSYNDLQISDEQRNVRIETVKKNISLDQERKKKLKITRMRQNISNNRNSLIKFIRTEWKNEDCDQCFQEIQKFETESVFMELQEPQINSYSDLKQIQRQQLSPQERIRAMVKNVSMHVELDDDDFSDTGKGTMNSINI